VGESFWPVQLAALQTLALSVAEARSPELVLKEVVRGLGMTHGIALARVWLLEGEDSERALRLRASVGLSRVDPELRWDKTDGAHARLPLGYGKVGQIASSGQPLLLQRGPRDWLLQADWAEREHIESFAGQPLVFKGEVLGALAVFSREPLAQRELDWLRVFADHAAVAIAMARAFEELGRLKNGDEPPSQRDLGTVISADRWRELERDNIQNALEQTGWKISGNRGAAALLGLKPSTLSYRMKSLGIVRP
jgi:transcriptional regulator with GAF, ATPase, and Fis domain